MLLIALPLSKHFQDKMGSNVNKHFCKNAMLFIHLAACNSVVFFPPLFHSSLISVPHLVVFSGCSWVSAWGSLVAVFEDPMESDPPFPLKSNQWC